MMLKIKWIVCWSVGLALACAVEHGLAAETASIRHPKTQVAVPLYPHTHDQDPGMASPWTAEDRTEVVTVRLKGGRYAVFPVTLADRPSQLEVDQQDFPTLARTGLHSGSELSNLITITGRSLNEITELGRPGGLSTNGFLSGDEDILSVLTGDNRLVAKLKLTHPQLARPLFHIWNLIQLDVKLGNWNRDRHAWENAEAIWYHRKKLRVSAELTKGGQKSIFADGITGSVTIDIRRDLEDRERAFLAAKYKHLDPEQFAQLTETLSHISTGEIEPHYIMRYGFYEGHTGWRTDPLAIAFVFGLRDIEQIERAFPGRIFETLTHHFVRP